MGDGGLAILGVGLASHLGGATQAAAAARAGIQRTQPLPGFMVHDPESDEMVDLRGFSATVITHGFEARARLLQLAEAALGDLYASVPTVADFRHLGLVIVLSGYGPEHEAAQRQQADGDEAALADASAEAEEQRGELMDLASTLTTRITWLKPQSSVLFFGEHTGVVPAITQAQTWLDDGSCDGCLVLALDSLIDPRRIPALLAGDLLATPANPHAFTGGEAGAVMLLTATVAGHRPLATLGPVALATEERSEDVGAFIRILGEVVATAGNSAAGTLLLDLTGETWRFALFGHVLARLAGSHPHLPDLRQRLIADSFGELGAATGVVGCVLACRALVRGYAHDATTLILLSDRSGERAVMAVQPYAGIPL